MSTHQKKVTTIFLLLLITVTVKCYSQYAVGVSYGLDPKERYVDMLAPGRYVKNGGKVNLSVSRLWAFSNVIGMLQVSSSFSHAYIRPNISGLPQKAENTKNYFGYNISGKAILGTKLIAPIVGLNIGGFPKYPYKIDDYTKKESNAAQWGFSGGLACFMTPKSLFALTYDYGQILPGGKGAQYSYRYGYVTLSYNYCFSALNRKTFKQWRQSRRSKKE